MMFTNLGKESQLRSTNLGTNFVRTFSEVAGIDPTSLSKPTLPHHCATPPRHKKPRAQWLACLSVQSYLYGRCSVLPLFHGQPTADPGTICLLFVNDAFLYQNSPFGSFSPRLFVSSGFQL